MNRILGIFLTVGVLANCGSDNDTVTGSKLNTSRGIARIEVSDGPSYNFGGFQVGTVSQSKAFTVTNSGSGVASSLLGGVTGSFKFKGGKYPGAGGDCTDTLSPGLYCLIVVEYMPSAPGNSTGSLILQYHDNETTQAVTLSLMGNAISNEGAR
jgi:hypothetical protein